MFARKLSMTFFALVILIGGLVLNAQPALASSCQQYHTVATGETLNSIAAQYKIDKFYLMKINYLPFPWLVFKGQRLCVADEGERSHRPAIQIHTTVRDTSVSLSAYLYKVRGPVDIYLGAFGTNGVNGIKVASAVANGSFSGIQGTYNIPAQLKGASRIAVRIQSRTTAWAVHSSFYNMTSVPNGYSDTPSVTVTKVVHDKSFTITLHNAPPNLLFGVYLGEFAQHNGKMISVGSLSSGVGGTITATFNIPSTLAGSRGFYLWLQDPTTGSYAYNTFSNTNK